MATTTSAFLTIIHLINVCIVSDQDPPSFYCSIAISFFIVLVHFIVSQILLLFHDCSLACNNIGNEGAVALAEALEHNNTLTTLKCVVVVIDELHGF